MTSTNMGVGEFSKLSEAMWSADDEQARLQLAVDAAVGLVEHCDHAGFTVNENVGALATRVGSDDVVLRANELQFELGEGPCLDVARDQVTLICPDLTDERRYPAWAARVHTELGVGSMMSLLVYTSRDSYGCLSLYADEARCFDSDDVVVAETLAAHLAIEMRSGREITQLGQALNNRLMIGRAEGILMERLRISSEQAFDYLRRISSHTNRKLVVVADEIVSTRKLPS